eukprot:gene14471-16901_t
MIASLSVLLVALLALVVVSSEDVRAFKHPLTDMPGPAEDVSTVQYFPNQPDLKLPIGEVITVLCHFSNEGSGYYNISGVMGSLNAPIDFRHHFQNYSYKPFGIVVKGGEEISLKYTFQLHPELDPVDYQLAVTVFYDSESESFSNTFFNQTVELYLPTSEYDFDTIASVLFSLASTGLVILLAVFACFPETKFSQDMTRKLKKLLPGADATAATVKKSYRGKRDGSDEDSEED